MSGYVYRGTKPTTVTELPKNIRLLTRHELEAMPEPVRAVRRAHWQGIIRGLQLEHDRRYHAHTPGDTRTICRLEGCDRPISRGGLCERDYMRAYRAKRKGQAA